MNGQMRTAIVDRYGPPETVRIATAPIPTPRAGEVLVRVEAAAVTSGDARLRSGRFPRGFAFPARLAIGVRGPRRKVPGVVFTGEVASRGDGVDDVDDVALGDRVAGLTGARLGAHAEYVVVRASAAAVIPEGVTAADAAAALFGGSTALSFLVHRARIQQGQRVLINGGSGSVGTAAIQLAARAGAAVTALSSAPNHELLRRLGAAETIDYRTTPIETLPQRFDAVLDAVGNVRRADGLRLTDPNGVVMLAVAGLWDTATARGRVIAGPVPERREDFATILDLIAKGDFDPLTEVVGGLDALPEAHRRIDTGRKVGNLVITL
ncbi:NAD(P)-dependent alcohol dehydrogenase [Microbacterium sp. ZW T5_56]|uniref:NAD(P)-dependent alcohol dehydrogenase n=1 Tax=Microbacterium sp. ZW T5_56 TaxID=3378081 RepID=UPI0038523F51